MSTYSAKKSDFIPTKNRCLWDVSDETGKKVGFVITLDNVTEAGAIRQFITEEKERDEGQIRVEKLHP